MRQSGKHFVWWMAFFFATFSLSKVFEASRAITGETGEGSIWVLLMWALALLVSFLVLVYDSYIKSRAEGKVVRRLWLFEKLYQHQQREHKEQ